VSVDNIVELCQRDASRISKEINRAVQDGFKIWHFWDDTIEDGDEVRQFGMVTFWKPHPGKHKNLLPPL
jgi:hypothetical protein